MTYLNFTFQDPSPLIAYSANQWVEGTTNDSSFDLYSGGSFKRTSNAGATASLTFFGTSITISGGKRINHGNYSVILDGGPEFVGDGNSLGDDRFQFPLWNAQNLNNNIQHTVIMANIQTDQGNNLDIDFISIGREIGPPGFTGPIFNVTLDDESPFVAYNGSWSPSSSSSAFNSSTIQEGSSISVFFQGSSIELYGLYVNAPLQAHIDSQIPVDLAGPNSTLLTQEEHPQTLLFLADGLDENETHVATLVNSVSDSNRPLYFDFAIVRSSQKFFENTQSPNSNFTIPVSDSPTSTNTPSRNATSPPFIVRQTTATGTIVGGVVGGVAGLIVSAFIAFIFFRRSKYYHQTTGDVNGHTIPPSSSLRQPNIREPIPFILPVTPNSPLTHTNLKGTVDSNQAVTVLSQQPHFQPLGLTSSSRGLSQEVSLSPIESMRTGQLLSPLPSLNSSYGNSVIAQTYIMQEQDAGHLVQTRLPPIYDDIWQNNASL